MDICKVGAILNDTNANLSSRFRALFMLRNAGGKDAVEEISRCFVDKSDLLNHELAYCLGQMQNDAAIPKLVSLLENIKLAPILRHEAGEALGAIGNPCCLSVLETFAKDSVQEVAETCELAIEKIKWLKQMENASAREDLIPAPFTSVDPAPSGKISETNVNILKDIMVNKTKPLFERYRAMFSLRNLNNTAGAIAIAEGLKCEDSALFRHEIAYVLGQLQNDAVVTQLSRSLSNEDENCMVRHECAEALGSIASSECLDILQKFLTDPDDIVRESCEVALDMYNYEHSQQLNYELNV
uniref:Deoxyhypusine hydroxylase n=1 Tax=Phallusia mammillata TaxID=59560 RepID=A0A6F9DBV3_9ASCI|nr:deoxyhypusine hydroxylase-like [Phallusia mammillata]